MRAVLRCKIGWLAISIAAVIQKVNSINARDIGSRLERKVVATSSIGSFIRVNILKIKIVTIVEIHIVGTGKINISRSINKIGIIIISIY